MKYILGMGIWDEGDAFDITGTSEHPGYLRTDLPQIDDGLVAGGYFHQNVHYGVTAASGVSLAYGRSFGDIAGISEKEILAHKLRVLKDSKKADMDLFPYRLLLFHYHLGGE